MGAAQQPSQQIVDEFVGVAHGDFDRVKELLAQYPALIHANATWNETPIQAAAQMGRKDMVEYLLNAGAPLDICTAAMMGMEDQVRSLLASDPASPQATGAHGIPLMYYPVISGEQDIAELLLAHGTPVDSDTAGNTPLHGAAAFNRPQMAEWLIQHGANIDATDYEGKTPLQRALERNHTGVADVLTKHGAKSGD